MDNGWLDGLRIHVKLMDTNDRKDQDNQAAN